MVEQTYYDTLQVSSKADIEVIRAAYRQLALKYHPDQAKTTSSEEKMRQINEAFETLEDPIKRAVYDRTISTKVNTKPPTSTASPYTPKPPPKSKSTTWSASTDQFNQRVKRTHAATTRPSTGKTSGDSAEYTNSENPLRPQHKPSQRSRAPYLFVRIIIVTFSTMILWIFLFPNYVQNSSYAGLFAMINLIGLVFLVSVQWRGLRLLVVAGTLKTWSFSIVGALLLFLLHPAFNADFPYRYQASTTSITSITSLIGLVSIHLLLRKIINSKQN